MRVPQDLQSVIGKKEFHLSLRTRNSRSAAAMAHTLLNNSTAAFTTARHHLFMGLDEDQIRSTVLSTLTGKSSRPSTGRYSSSANEKLFAQQSETRLSALVEQFIEDRKTAWSPKTLLQNSSALKQFVAIVGDKPIADINRKDCRAYRDLLRKLPPNATKRFRGVSFEKIAAFGEPPMSPKNVNRVLGAITAFFNWAVREEFTAHNPTRSLGVPLTNRADSQRDAFSMGDLRVLFELSPLYQGCKSTEHRDAPGNIIIRDAKFWLPLVALYSGMRLEEIAQLRTEDVRQVDDVWVLDVNENHGSRLKTSDSHRHVPIHPTLINIGLLDHAAETRLGGHDQLWPDLQKGNDGYYSSPLSKWFSRYKRKIGITNPKVTFHSFRHTVINRLKQAGIDESKIKELVGHKENSITMGRYGKRFEPSVLIQTVEKLDFGLIHPSL